MERAKKRTTRKALKTDSEVGLATCTCKGEWLYFRMRILLLGTLLHIGGEGLLLRIT